MQAMKTLFYVPRLRGQTILHPLKAKYGRVLLSAWPKSSHGGIKANNLMASICKLAGIVNIGIKVSRSYLQRALHGPCRSIVSIYCSRSGPDIQRVVCRCNAAVPQTINCRMT